MNCPNCGNAIQEGGLFCTSCGSPVAQAAPAQQPVVPEAPAAPEPVVEAPVDVDAEATPEVSVGEAFEEAVAAPEPAVGSAVEVVAETEPAAPVASASPASVEDVVEAVAPAPAFEAGAVPEAPAAPEAAAAPIAEAVPAAVAAPEAVAATVPAAVAAPAPFPAADAANPYAAQQPYGQYAQQPGAPGYAPQPGYQPQPQVKQKVYAQTTGVSRALAMSAYWGLLPLIFTWAVGDKDNDPFIRHHLNQALVILIGSLIAGVLSLIVIGFILAIYLLVVTIIGTVNAYNSEMTELPLIGKIKILK